MHAGRIPATMLYGRAQNNNHLLSEAAGLYTAGLSLPDHPQARAWCETGWRWFHDGLQTQIDADGAYSQHSTGYHRLMLQLALWVHMLAQKEGRAFPEKSKARLAAAVGWLLRLVDADSGRAPNLGPQDGANILPLAACEHADYRPVVQSAAQTFLGWRPNAGGRWDEMGAWLRVGRVSAGGSAVQLPARSGEGGVLHMPQRPSWAYLRAVHFHSRPGHADQLHLDLWWQGMNIAMDPGSYLYNAAPPWDNALARTAAHNTLSVEGCDQMTRAGRFLWLDRAQATGPVFEQAQDGSWERLTASHDGYRRLGVIHRRCVNGFAGVWRVKDTLLPANALRSANGKVSCQLHWLLPDWEWQLERQENGAELRVHSLQGWIRLAIGWKSETLLEPPGLCFLYRAGECLDGGGPAAPILGWTAPTYGHKIPALSLVTQLSGGLPLNLTSEWRLP